LTRLHLTSHGFAILGEYIVNRLDAPLTLAPHSRCGVDLGDGFASTLYGKARHVRETYGFMPATMNAYAAYAKAPISRPPAAARQSVVVLHPGNGGISDRSNHGGLRTASNLDSVGGTIALSNRFGTNALSAVHSITPIPGPPVQQCRESTEANSYQLGIYGAWADAALLRTGARHLRLAELPQFAPRRGPISSTSNPDGTNLRRRRSSATCPDVGKSQIARSAA